MTPEFTDLAHAPATLRGIFVSLGLAREDESPKITQLAGGISSGILRVEFNSGVYCLKQALPKLKVAKEWHVPVERVFAEIGWLETVGEIVPGSVPKVLGQDTASKSFVMEYLPDSYRNWKSDLLASRVEPSIAAAVGAVLGKIHAATARSASLAARFATDANFYAIRLEPYLVEASRHHPGVRSRLNELVERTQGTHLALVHGDVSPKNIMIGPNGPVFLDAECAWYGDPAFDLAFCLNHLLLKAAWLPAVLPALMESFRSLVDTYMARVNFEPIADLEYRAATLLPALTLARVDGKSPVEYLDEPARIAIRAAALDLLKDPRDCLDDVRGFWTRKFST
ncbi:MAG: aminoglycoside phosphotransferase family protein [Burkholderiaceae bacterium]